MVEHKETYLKINGELTVKLRSGLIKFKNLPAPFKIYPDFEKKETKILDTMKNIKIIYLTVLLIKSCVLMIDLANRFSL